jgi:hypothetical protein
MAISLLLTSFTFTACKPWFISTKRLFGEARDKFPAVVLSTQSPGSHDYTFDWDKNTVGGVSLANVQPNKKYWRLNLYKFKTGEVIGNFKDCKSFADRTETFTGLDFDKLVRADLDVANDPNCMEDAETFSLNFLLHDDE